MVSGTPEKVYVRMALIQPDNPDHYEPDCYLEPYDGLAAYMREDIISNYHEPEFRVSHAVAELLGTNPETRKMKRIIVVDGVEYEWSLEINERKG